MQLAIVLIRNISPARCSRRAGERAVILNDQNQFAGHTNPGFSPAAREARRLFCGVPLQQIRYRYHQLSLATFRCSRTESRGQWPIARAFPGDGPRLDLWRRPSDDDPGQVLPTVRPRQPAHHLVRRSVLTTLPVLAFRTGTRRAAAGRAWCRDRYTRARSGLDAELDTKKTDSAIRPRRGLRAELARRAGTLAGVS